MTCKICSKENKVIFSGEILKKYKVDYFYCDTCKFLQTEEPYWLNEAYKYPINIYDTGYMFRNIYYSKRLTILLSVMFSKNGSFLDYAGGYGVFVRLMRDNGFDFYWDDKYTENKFAKGFENNGKITNYDAITLFEVFEHLDNPTVEIENLLKMTKTLIFSTDILPRSIPNLNQWDYYGQEHGQHISFYSIETFKFIAKKYSLNYYNDASLHILTNLKISNLKIKLTKLAKFGLHKFYLYSRKSKTYSDHLLLKKL